MEWLISQIVTGSLSIRWRQNWWPTGFLLSVFRAAHSWINRVLDKMTLLIAHFPLTVQFTNFSFIFFILYSLISLVNNFNSKSSRFHSCNQSSRVSATALWPKSFYIRPSHYFYLLAICNNCLSFFSRKKVKSSQSLFI